MKKSKKTPRKKLEEELEKLIILKLFTRHGVICQICRKEHNLSDNGKPLNMGQFHILPKGAFPNLKYHPKNILWAGWFCCHYIFHHDFYKARDTVIPLLEKLLGEGYEQELRELSMSLPNMTISEIEKYIEVWNNY